MHRAASQRIVSRITTPPAPLECQTGSSALVDPLIAERRQTVPERTNRHQTESSASTDRSRQLEIIIRQRIESRLPGRVRNLAIHAAGDRVLLEGQCSTYYTKQIAQHAAMGVLLETEQLENAIVVAVVQS
jgi:hypothetical protein